MRSETSAQLNRSNRTYTKHGRSRNTKQLIIQSACETWEARGDGLEPRIEVARWVRQAHVQRVVCRPRVDLQVARHPPVHGGHQGSKDEGSEANADGQNALFR